MANMQGQKEGSGRDIPTRMRNLSNGNKGLSYQDFKQTLKETRYLPIDEFQEVVTFATDQYSFWSAEWLFSPADHPNTLAKAEIDGWRPLLDVCTDELVKRVPKVKELLEEQKELCLLQHVIQRRRDYNKTRPLEKLLAIVLGKTSIALNKFGFKRIALKLYSYHLYPKGTIGRTRK